MAAEYDQIGIGYARVRRADPRLAALIDEALDGAKTVVNVGAGTGSYEPTDALVVAVEPSATMLAAHHGSARVQGVAEALPFRDDTFAAAMAVLTVHHWQDLGAGLAEMRRVSRRQVIFTWDPGHANDVWLVDEYVPEIHAFEHGRFAPLTEVVDLLGAHTVIEFPIPYDFNDGFQAAYWRRPEAYLDPGVRAGISTLAVMPPHVIERATRQLAKDIRSGVWAARHADLLQRESVDYGHRLLIAG